MKRPPVELDSKRCGTTVAPRKTTTVPKVLRPYKGDPRYRVAR